MEPHGSVPGYQMVEVDQIRRVSKPPNAGDSRALHLLVHVAHGEKLLLGESLNTPTFSPQEARRISGASTVLPTPWS